MNLLHTTRVLHLGSSHHHHSLVCKDENIAFFSSSFSPFQKCGGPVRRKSRFLNRNSGGGSDQREYVAHCSNGSFNVRFTIMFIGACVAEGDKAMDTFLSEQAVVDRSVLEKKRNLFFAVHIGQELFGLTVD